MLESTVDDYKSFLDVDLEYKLQPINESIDHMLVRLEEFQTMVTMVQQERCNAIGLTGSLVETLDCQKDLEKLCSRIDTVEKLMGYIKTNISGLESKMDAAEEHYGLVDNTNRLKNFLMPMFKKSPDTRSKTPTMDESCKDFNIDKFFTTEQ